MIIEISSAYIHFPFCMNKCPYCDFVSYAGCLDKCENYIEALCREITLSSHIARSTKTAGQPVLETIYMGGGTPSLFSASQLDIVLKHLDAAYGILKDAEITLEINPGTVDKKAFEEYKAIGINRISIGVQSFSPSLLGELGRIHSPEQAKSAIGWAKAAGFSNISCDLMTGLAGQTMNDVQDSLSILLDSHIPHISFYALTLEEGTPYFDKYFDREEIFPSPEAERDMYHKIVDRLKKEGYIHYEISNCAKPGYESRHNMTYWRARPYFGFGCGAASYRTGKRIKNTADLSYYIRELTSPSPDIVQLQTECEPVNEIESQKEFMLLGFRTMAGVSVDDFRTRYGLSMEEIFRNQLNRLIDRNLIVNDSCRRYYLSEKGLDYANEVFREFVGK